MPYSIPVVLEIWDKIKCIRTIFKISHMKEFDELINIMVALRDPESGCPWDKEQTIQSLVPYTWEEINELVDALEREDMAGVRDELGDLLFHIIYYSQIISENDGFEIRDVVENINQKLIRRHPHVFADSTINNAAEQTEVWERIKRDEHKGQKDEVLLLDDISKGLAPVQRALKLQKRAATVGFDWDNISPVMDKIVEELHELKSEIETNADDARKAEEFGDLMFACVNLARHLNIDPELSLRHTNHKFEQRFGYIENEVRASGKTLEDVDLNEMERLWQEAKKVLG
jgi:ATP diphosphatase